MNQLNLQFEQFFINEEIQYGAEGRNENEAAANTQLDRRLYLCYKKGSGAATGEVLIKTENT